MENKVEVIAVAFVFSEGQKGALISMYNKKLFLWLYCAKNEEAKA